MASLVDFAESIFCLYPVLYGIKMNRESVREISHPPVHLPASHSGHAEDAFGSQEYDYLVQLLGT